MTESSEKKEKRYRFIVRSAEEAVRTIRENLGENARVLSVKQVDGKGLSKFLSSPKLEVIATVQDINIRQELADAKDAAISKGSKKPKDALNKDDNCDVVRDLSVPFDLERPLIEGHSDKMLNPEFKNNFNSDCLGVEEAHTPSERPYGVGKRYGFTRSNSEKPIFQEEGLSGVLRRVGFADKILLGFEQSPRWKKLEGLSLAQGLSEISHWLKEDYRRVPQKKLSNRIAFIGTPGSGKTTALCKRLARDVFIERKKVQVLKLENDMPNVSTGLQLFCDVLGVEFLRSEFDHETFKRDKDLYIDSPGIPARDVEAWYALKKRLDVLKVDTRVLVIHAAYHEDIIKSIFHVSREVGATHLVLTHMDEVLNPVSLWSFVLKGGLPLLFFTDGQNVTSEYEEDALSCLLEKTFPSILMQ